MPITHAFVSPKSNTSDATLVQPSNWNANHVIDIFVDNETPVGLVNGENNIYTLASTPSPASSLQFFVNGALQQVGVDYTLSGNTITCLRIPNTGDILRAWYRKA